MQDSNVTTQFIERFGLLFEAEGLPRIAGRIMAFLLLQDGPCHFDDLRQELRIAHGSVSTNTRLLENLGIVERLTFPGDRRAYVRLTEDPFGSFLLGAIQRTRKIEQTLAQTRPKLPKSMKQSEQRLARMQKFYRILIRSLETAGSEWESGAA